MEGRILYHRYHCYYDGDYDDDDDDDDDEHYS